jgi:DNA-binding transcriptional LysR family regulator
VWARIAGRTRAGGVTGSDGDDLSAGLDLVAAGAGVMPTPRLLVESVRRGDLAFVPLDAPGLALVYGLVWSPERATDALLTLVGTVHEVLRVAGPHAPASRAVPVRAPTR